MTAQSISAAILIVLRCRRASDQWSKNNSRAFRIALLASALSISFTAHTFAQAGKGAVEMGIDGGPFIIIATGAGETIGVLGAFGEPRIDYFLADNLDIGASGFFYHSLDSESSLPPLSFGGAFGHLNYHFSPGSELSPYIGARIGALTSGTETLFGFGTQLGLKYFVARLLSINGQLTLSVFPTSGGFGLLSSLGLGISYHTQ